MRVRGKVGSIGVVVVGVEIVVGKIVLDNEEPESESGVEIAVESWVEITTGEIEVEIVLSPTPC
jgi:hypothetical protein